MTKRFSIGLLASVYASYNSAQIYPYRQYPLAYPLLLNISLSAFAFQNYATHDLRVWGPRAVLQRDSYSWTDKDKVNLQALRLNGNAVSSVPTKFDPYQKLPPITNQRNNTIAPGFHDDGMKWRS